MANAGQQPPPQDWETSERLIGLRTLLEEAQARSAFAPATDRHAAIVLLDGACELALGIVLDARGASRPKTERFHDLFQKVAEELGSTWPRPGWPGVRLMHEARNGAQHHGFHPDPEQLARWAVDAGRFVHGLIAAATGVDLAAVTRSAAVSHVEVRDHLAAAEVALREEDSAEAVREALAAFSAARSDWARHRGGMHARLNSIHFRELEEAVKAALESAETLSEVQAFAPDISDFRWLEKRWPFGWVDEDDEITMDEARRAVSFVFGWVLRWEAFTQRTVTPKRRVEEKPVRPPATGNPERGTRIIDVATRAGRARQRRGLATEETWTVAVSMTIADPPEEHFPRWADHLRTALKKVWTENPPAPYVQPPDFRNDGTVSFHAVPAATDKELLVSVVNEAIVRAGAAVERDLERQDWWQRQGRSELLARFEAELLQLHHKGEQVIRAVRIEAAGPGAHVVIGELAEGVGKRLSSSAARNVLRRSATATGGQVRMSSTADPAAVAAEITEALEAADTAVAVAAQEEAERTAVAQHADHELRTLLGLPPSTT